jgi:hypothetical protein
MKSTISSSTTNGPVLTQFLSKCGAALTFRGSRNYWEKRYAGGRDSGAGSYGRLAKFKADCVNAFVTDNAIKSVIEFGPGDGNQLSLADYPRYIGLDVSRTAVSICQQRFSADRSKSFFLYEPSAFTDHQRIFSAELALSLDVIYHLVEDDVFATYMTHLFNAADRFVIVYSSDREDRTITPHVRHRRFTAWVEQNVRDWVLLTHFPNEFPYDPHDPDNTSFADFFVYERRQ